MIIDFQQGIITYPSLGGQQRFLTFNGGYVNLVADNGRVDIAFTHGIENYLHTEYTTVSQAWGPITPNVNAWLYWDIDPRSAVRSFGVTYVQPVYGSTQPASPVNDQHWFDTNTNQHKVYRSNVSRWVVVIRVFACRVNNSQFSPLGTSITSPYAGTQVGLPAPGTSAGRIIVDVEGKPIRRSNGLFFTTEDEFFANGSPISSLRLEATVLDVTAQENIATHQVVKYTEFGEVLLATYNDTQTTAIAMSMENISTLQAGAVCIQGIITNPNWDWQSVGAPLWIHGSIPGYLTDEDPHVADSLSYPTMKPPVARVLTPHSIYFDQGLGGYGRVVNSGGSSEATYLGDLLDVSTTNPLSQQYLKFNGAEWVNSTLALALTDMTDVTTTTPSADQYLKFNGTQWVNAALPAAPTYALDSLTDVTTTTPAADQYLKYNGTTWVNASLPASPTYTLDSLTDVTTTTPAADQYLKYNGSQWINAALPATPEYSLDSLTDVVVTTPSTDQVLSYSGTEWVNTTLTIPAEVIIFDPLSFNVTGPLAVPNGNRNLVYGYGSLSQISTGDDNIMIGSGTGPNIITGSNNVGIGSNAMYNSTNCSNNIMIGGAAGSNISSGSNNTIIGALFGPASLSDTVLIGAGSTERIRVTATGLYVNGIAQQQTIPIACSDETTGLTAGTGKVTFRMPYAFTLTAVRASLTTAQTSGNIFTVNVRHDGTSIFSTKITIDNTEKTSFTAATPNVLSITSLANDAEVIVDIDQIGDGTAKGLKVYLIGYNA